MAMARMRRACLASAVRAASARNCEILRSWRVISIADMLPAPRINDVLHRVTFAAGWESPMSQVLGRLVSLWCCAVFRPSLSPFQPRHGRVVVSKVRLSAVSLVVSWDTAELGRPPGALMVCIGGTNTIGNGRRLAAPATRQMDLRANRGDD